MKRQLRALGILVWFAIVGACVQNEGQAAEITFGPGPDTVNIIGAISAGDLENFKSKLPENPDSLRVVLNSTGGLVDVAFGLIDVIKKHKMQTIVPQSGICLSACAYIFMNGTQPKLHYTAQLGFHATWINLSDTQRATGLDIRMAFREGQQDIKRLLATENIPLDLILEFIDKGPDEFFLIDTAHKARVLGISVFGFYDSRVYPWKTAYMEFAGVAPFASAAHWALIGMNQTKLAPAKIGETEVTSFRELARLWRPSADPDSFWGKLGIEVTQMLERLDDPKQDHGMTSKQVRWGAQEAIVFHVVTSPENINVQFRDNGDLVVYEDSALGQPQPTFLNPLYSLPPGLKLARIPQYQLELLSKGSR